MTEAARRRPGSRRLLFLLIPTHWGLPLDRPPSLLVLAICTLSHPLQGRTRLPSRLSSPPRAPPLLPPSLPSLPPSPTCLPRLAVRTVTGKARTETGGIGAMTSARTGTATGSGTERGTGAARGTGTGRRTWEAATRWAATGCPLLLLTRPLAPSCRPQRVTPAACGRRRPGRSRRRPPRTARPPLLPSIIPTRAPCPPRAPPRASRSARWATRGTGSGRTGGAAAHSSSRLRQSLTTATRRSTPRLILILPLATTALVTSEAMRPTLSRLTTALPCTTATARTARAMR